MRYDEFRDRFQAALREVGLSFHDAQRIETIGLDGLDRRLPRIWDDPGRRDREQDSGEDLARLAGRFRNALEQWTGSVTELARWIRYSPPPTDAKPVEPSFDDTEDKDGGDENGGPPSIH